MGKSAEEIVKTGKNAVKKFRTTYYVQQNNLAEVGRALLVGWGNNPDSDSFKKWCLKNGFDEMNREEKIEAMCIAVDRIL